MTDDWTFFRQHPWRCYRMRRCRPDELGGLPPEGALAALEAGKHIYALVHIARVAPPFLAIIFAAFEQFNPSDIDEAEIERAWRSGDRKSKSPDAILIFDDIVDAKIERRLQ
ncbi:hypothetical protein [Methylocella sp.]|jgi:hypothetical protein|uniref:hypothetical protein n=1 Tax=Methylocella sp. TaxID=1978226 RepID=UPI003C2452D7